MNLLLDTHMLIWTFLDSEKLPTFARNLIADYQNTIYFSMASMWEVEIKHIKIQYKCLMAQNYYMNYV